MCRFVILVNLCHGSLLYRLFHHLGIQPSTQYLFFLILPLFPTPWQAPLCDVPLCPRVLIIQFPLMSKSMQCLVFCSCVSMLAKMVSSFIHVLVKDMNSFFFTAAWYSNVYICHIFFNPVYHWWAFGLVPGLCYCNQWHKEYICACVFVIERFIILWIYAQ